MGFETVQQKKSVIRFHEFDEARPYIVEWQHHTLEFIFAAIDYMIGHNEYYFLLKNFTIPTSTQNRTKYHTIIEYLFSRIDCLKREIDKKELKKLLLHEDAQVTNIVLSYILQCYKDRELFQLLEGVDMNQERLQFLMNTYFHNKEEFLFALRQEFQKRLALLDTFLKDRPCSPRKNS